MSVILTVPEHLVAEMQQFLTDAIGPHFEIGADEIMPRASAKGWLKAAKQGGHSGSCHCRPCVAARRAFAGKIPKELW